VCKFLAHAGLSISTTSINNAVTNLSRKTGSKMWELGKSLLTSYVYNNLDIDLKHSVPTLETSQDTLIHLTSGTMLPLYKVTANDLDCSNELWAKSQLNPDILQSALQKVDIVELPGIHPEQDHPSGFLRDECFNAWKFLHDLLNYGPKAFQKHKTNIIKPERVDTIPLKKSSQVPNTALDVAPSTPAQNAEALDLLFKQAGIGDLKENSHVQSTNNSVILEFGDLLTGEHI
jgi:hypothetical protein